MRTIYGLGVSDGFDYRNESLREWIVNEFMMGSMGMGHAAVDGFLTDDWYTTHGPSELQHFVQGTGIQHNSSTMLELMGKKLNIAFNFTGPQGPP